MICPQTEDSPSGSSVAKIPEDGRFRGLAALQSARRLTPVLA
jgi:hypothetical protein